MGQTSANWIFQVVSRRYDKGSVILTSNREFADWGQACAPTRTPLRRGTAHDRTAGSRGERSGPVTGGRSP
jgi:DNA replication protein DnaC